MDKLPDLVKSALTAACNSGKALSWKVQESDKWTLIQLVWKPRLESSLVASESQDTVCSNWNTRKTSSSTWKTRKLSDTVTPETLLESWNPANRRGLHHLVLAGMQGDYKQNQSELVCKPASQSTVDVDLDLKSFIDKEVQCVDFNFTN